MASGTMNVLVGTIGQGVMRSPDGGQTWQRVGIDQGMHSDALVRCLINHPRQPEVVFAGTELGLLRSQDGGRSWRSEPSALDHHAVWKLAVHPSDPSIMFAGTGTPGPAAVFRSDDGGLSWEQLPVAIAERCDAVGVPRVTGLAIDPLEPNSVWVGIEVDGFRHSRDGGASWESGSGGIANRDVHAVAVAAGPPRSVFVVVNNDVFVSRDDGATWTAVKAAQVFPWTYSRGIAVSPGRSDTIFVAIGDSTPGRTGTIMRTTDTGSTWQQLDLSVPPNSAMWVVDVRPEDPNVVFAASRYGYLYRSDDGGDSWTKLWRELSEVSSLLWTPG